MILCKHCVRRKADYGRKGLCFKCGTTPAICRLYRSTSKHDPHKEDFETMEDVERIIAEQMAMPLPRWWPQSDKMMAKMR